MPSDARISPFAGLKIPTVAEIAAQLQVEEERLAKMTPAERRIEDARRELVARGDYIHMLRR